MPSPLRALIVEDNLADTELLVHELEKSNFEVSWQSAGSREELRARFDDSWDVVLLDYNIPQLDAIESIHFFRQRSADLPIIMITGSIGDEAAAHCIKAGATDYLLKDRLARLGPAVRAALLRQRLEAEKQQADRLVRESEARLRALTEALPVMIWTAEPDGSLDYFNERWFEYSGMCLEQSKCDGWRQAIHSADLPNLLITWATNMTTGEAFEAECRILRGKGAESRWHLIRALAAVDGGRIVKWYGTMTDIHDRKLAEEGLERSNKALREFAYAAAHDLQEPLRNVAVVSDMLTRLYKGKLDEDADELLAANVEAGKRMLRMVKGLLSYTKVLEDSASTPSLNDSGEALGIALRNMAESIRDARAEITHDALPSVFMEEMHLVQLFQNLISNSLKYRSPDREPRIHVSAEQNGPHWVFAVRDNGIGFDPVYQERIFGLFKRLHRHQEYEGAGIGLAICSRIVEHYGGRIWAEGEPQQGATFFFELTSDGNRS